MSTPAGRKSHLWADVPLCLSIALIGSILLGWSAMQVFDFFDMSAFLDAGYRVYSGQRPYVDFYYPTGPVHLYLHAFSFALFGFNKAAVLAHLLSVNTVVVVLTYVLARRTLPLLISAGLTILSAICFYGPIAHPWYDQNAFLWLILSVTVIEFLPPGGPAASLLSPLLCGFLIGLCFLTKSNIGLAGVGAFFLLFAVQKRPWNLLALYIAGGLLSLLLTLAVLDSPSAFLFQMFFAFDLTSRLVDLGRLWLVLNFLPYLQFVILLAVVCALGGWGWVKEHRNRVVLLAGLLFTSVFGVFSGSKLPAAGINLVALQLVFLFSLVRRLPYGPAGELPGRLRRAVTLVLVGVSLYWSVYSTQVAFQRTVWRWRGSNAVNDYVLKTESFKGWRCNAEIGAGVDQAVEYIRQNVPAGESLFVFPDATVVYGMTGRRSFPNAPFLFHLGKAPPPGPLYASFRNGFLKAPPAWILIHDQREVNFFDTERLLEWLKLKEFISENYVRKQQWGPFYLLRRE